MSHYIELVSRNPLTRGFAYFDLPSRQADRLLHDCGAKVRFDGDYAIQGSRYILVSCRAFGPNIKRVRRALEGLPNRLRSIGEPNYLKDCEALEEMLQVGEG